MDGWSAFDREFHLMITVTDGRTAEQAEAMMAPMQKSLDECLVSWYLHRFSYRMI